VAAEDGGTFFKVDYISRAVGAGVDPIVTVTFPSKDVIDLIGQGFDDVAVGAGIGYRRLLEEDYIGPGIHDFLSKDLEPIVQSGIVDPVTESMEHVEGSHGQLGSGKGTVVHVGYHPIGIITGVAAQNETVEGDNACENKDSEDKTLSHCTPPEYHNY